MSDKARYLHEVVQPYEGDECLIWPFKHRNPCGYDRVGGQIVSRLVCKHANGAPPTPKHEAAHSCGKGHLGCVAKRHLSWKTRTENQRDRLIHGTHSRGARSSSVKLTEAEVHEIRRSTTTPSQTAKRFGVSLGLVCDIRSRRVWAWLE